MENIMNKTNEIPAKKVTVPERAKQIAKIIQIDKPDYYYLKELFRGLRQEFNLKRQSEPKRLPYVPSEEEIKRYYDVVWNNQNTKHMVIVKLLLYTGIKISELVKIKIDDVKLQKCVIHIKKNDNDKKVRMVAFYSNFKQSLSEYIKEIQSKNKKEYLFESNWRKPFSPQGIRSILSDYSKLAQMKKNITPGKLRHFLLLWMKEQNIDDDLIQYYSGSESKEALKIYDKLKISNNSESYNKIMKGFPI
jgi:integrase/recombinase XerD